jgi:CubicO group peptidase (beta-lactamase class C family)
MKLRYGDPDEVGMSARRVRHVAQLAQSWVEQGITPALVVFAARRGIIVLHEAYGRLTPAPDAPALPRDAIFPLASLTKPITATAAMVLVEDGLLGLNRPVAEYIPEFTGEGKNVVMVHHLLTHTSGLRNEDLEAHAQAKDGFVSFPLPNQAWNTYFDPSVYLTIMMDLSLIYDAPLWKPPGTEMSYCDYNYALLGEIVQRVGGTPLNDFARGRIFEPLGMTDSSFIVPDVVRHRIVKRPPDAPDSYIDTRAWQDAPMGCDGVHATAMDMAIFGQMFLNGGNYGDARILSPASVAEMTRNQIPGIGAQFFLDQHFPEASWGYGWSITGNKKSRLFGSLYSPAAFEHGGAGGVNLWIDPVYELVGVYFSVWTRLTSESAAQYDVDRRADLFTNAVTAAVVH